MAKNNARGKQPRNVYCWESEALAEKYLLDTQADKEALIDRIKSAPLGSFSVTVGPRCVPGDGKYRRLYFVWVAYIAQQMGESQASVREYFDQTCLPERDDGKRSTKGLSEKAWLWVLDQMREEALLAGIELPDPNGYRPSNFVNGGN